ncbi:MAG: hypothetical protein E4H03_12355 [Myxococcales bacterium]|nr:MAG: hypothetical protein E4H03_12355 [Myxococcales bacterium]
MKLTYEQMRELLRLVEATNAAEIDCEEFLARVGAVLESLEPGENIPPEFRAVAQHLQVCGECKEEFDALMVAFRS